MGTSNMKEGNTRFENISETLNPKGLFKCISKRTYKFKNTFQNVHVILLNIFWVM